MCALAYDRYYDGRKMLGTACNSVRDLMTELYATLPADPKDTPRIHDIAEHIRRKLNVLMALIR
jgi:predicted membrane chloride channel (bestrophin family)